VGGADGDLFEVDFLTGALSFKTAPDFNHPADRNRDNVYRVEVKSFDGNSEDIQTVRVYVKANISLAPIISYILF
jgi:hypothetical protein